MPLLVKQILMKLDILKKNQDTCENFRTAMKFQEFQDRAQACEFHVNVFTVSVSGGQKPQFWAIFKIWGLLYRPHFTDEGQIWCARADPRSTLTG